MEVLQENHELVFLYSLVKGQGDSSQACHIAATAGLPREVVDRGAKVRRDPLSLIISNGNGNRQGVTCSWLMLPPSLYLRYQR